MGDNKENPYIFVSRSDEGDATLTIRDLTLKIPDTGRILTEPFDMTLEKGMRVMITGNLGTGKSTIVRAIVPHVWEGGSGDITLKEGAKFRVVSQKAYFPKTSLAGVLSTPHLEGYYSDRQMEDALRAVGHDRLVQYLPGRSVRHIVDQLMEKLPEQGIVRGRELSEAEIARLQDELAALVPGLVKNNIEIIGCVAAAEENYLRERLSLALDKAAGVAVSARTADRLAAVLADAINEGMTARLKETLAQDFPQLAKESGIGTDRYADIKQVKFYTRRIEKKLTRDLEKYLDVKRSFFTHAIKGEDLQTEERTRLARNLAKRLTAEVNKAFTPRLTQDYMAKRGPFRPLANAYMRLEGALEKGARGRGVLSAAFNVAGKLAHGAAVAASFAVDEAALLMKWRSNSRIAGKTADYLGGQAVAMMEKQKVDGEVLARTLSGGEQQKLLFARIFLQSPEIIVLDEVSSAMDEGSAEALYTLLNERLPDSTVISIAHNMNLLKFHTHQAELKDRVVTFKPLAPSP